MLFQKHKSLVCIGYVIVAIVFYLPAYRYGMVTDFLSWIYKYQAGTWMDVPSSFGYPGLHPVFHFFNYGFFKLFGLNKLIWSIAFAGLHGLNAFMLLRVIEAWTKNWGINSGHAIALIASVLFLISPYQVETVTWKACMHYLLSTFFLLVSFYYLLEYFKKPSGYQAIVLHHVLFVLALFCLEISLAAPFIFACYFLFHRKFSIVHSKRHLLLFNLPQALILFAYFLINKIALGSWVGHYGAEHHFSISWEGLVQNAINYFIKYTGLLHFVDFGLREFWYNLFAQLLPIILFLIISIILLFLVLKRNALENRKLFFSAANLLMFFMALVPIVTLYFMYVVPYQNDRYGYLASVFFYTCVAGLLFIIPKRWRAIVLVPYVILHLLLAYQSILNCRNAGKVLDGLVDSFEACDQDLVYVFGLADNYRGVYLYRDLNDEEAVTLAESIDLFSGLDCGNTKIIDVAQYNMNFIQDRIKVIKKDSTHYQLDFGQYENWWWKDGIGFRDFENEWLKVSKSDLSILVQDKVPEKNKLILKRTGLNWYEVK